MHNVLDYVRIELEAVCAKLTKPKDTEVSRLAGFARDILKIANARGGLEAARLPTQCVADIIRVRCPLVVFSFLPGGGAKREKNSSFSQHVLAVLGLVDRLLGEDRTLEADSIFQQYSSMLAESFLPSRRYRDQIPGRDWEKLYKAYLGSLSVKLGKSAPPVLYGLALCSQMASVKAKLDFFGKLSEVFAEEIPDASG